MVAASEPVAGLELLATLHDVLAARTTGQLEAATVAAARALFSADAAFWMDLVDGVLEMTALVGLAQPEAHQLSVVPPGSGIGADILGAGAPVAVENYGNDRRAVPSFASLFQREGIVSVGGAPIPSSEGVSGVLYVLSRRRRLFSDGELQLLASVAGIARVLRSHVLERESLAVERDDARLQVEAHAQLLGAATGLLNAMLDGEDLTAGLEAASDRLGVRLRVEGLPSRFGGEVPMDHSEGVPRRPRVEARIRGADSAVLVAEAQVHTDSLELLSRLISLDFHRRRAQVETEIRLTDQLVDSLLSSETADLERLWRRAKLIGMDLATPRAVLSIGHHQPADRALLDRLNRELRSRTSGGQATTYDGDVILLWPVPTSGDEEALRDQVESMVRSSRAPRLTAGIGPVCRGAEDYPAAVREAMFARQVAVHSTTEKLVVTTGELGMYRLFAHVGGMPALRAAVLETLGPLLHADARHGSDLAKTLRAFLERDRRLAETARALHLHVNTLRYRIDRIGRLLNVDLDDPEARFFTLLALRLSSIVGEGTRDGDNGGR